VSLEIVCMRRSLKNKLNVYRKGEAFPHARLEARTYREVQVLSRQTLSGL